MKKIAKLLKPVMLTNNVVYTIFRYIKLLTYKQLMISIIKLLFI